MRFLVLVLLVTACDRVTAPEPVTLGPGCWHVYTFPVANATPTILRMHYADCTAQNVDSLRTAGVVIEWDQH